MRDNFRTAGMLVRGGGREWGEGLGDEVEVDVEVGEVMIKGVLWKLGEILMECVGDWDKGDVMSDG